MKKKETILTLAFLVLLLIWSILCWRGDVKTNTKWFSELGQGDNVLLILFFIVALIRGLRKLAIKTIK